MSKETTAKKTNVELLDEQDLDAVTGADKEHEGWLVLSSDYHGVAPRTDSVISIPERTRQD